MTSHFAHVWLTNALRYYTCLAYKFIVSCYYWPAFEGRLRLRALKITTNHGLGPGLNFPPIGTLTSVETTPSSIERRRAQRLNINCDAEITANLSILDTEAPSSTDSLVFLGRTKDLSAGGLAFVLPSIQIDERFCGEGSRLRLCLYLPTGSVQLEIRPVRCEPLNPHNAGKGYFIGAQILSIDDQRDVYDSYLRSVTQ